MVCQKIILLGANNEKLYEVSKRICGIIKFYNTENTIQLSLIKNLLQNDIIGTDELDRHGVIIEYEQGQI